MSVDIEDAILEFLTMSFLRPTEEWLEEIRGLWKDISGHFSSVELELLDVSAMNQEYTRLFRFGKRVPCPPYESYYRTEDGTLMSPYAVDVEDRMRAFGVEVSSQFKDLPEHISVELEFLRYLRLLRDPEALKEAVSFLEDHVLTWVPVFCKCLHENSRINFYKQVCSIMIGFLWEIKDKLSTRI